jgi:3-hydroxyacyl-CoA dehydrogenase
LVTNILAGGGSFQQLLEHLGPAMRSWLDDMEKRKFGYSREEMRALYHTVEKLSSTLDIETMLPKRDGMLIDLLKLKSESGL